MAPPTGHPDFDDLWESLQTGDESIAIEAKTAEEFGKSCFETVSSFANEPGMEGGYFVLGVRRVPDSLFPEYEIIGVPNPDALQADVATQCRASFSSVVRPIIWVEARKKKAVVIVYIPEAPPYDKPIYIKSKGLHAGAFRRIGSTDQHCTDDDIALFYQLRDNKTYDETVIDRTNLIDIDEGAVAEYRRARKALNPAAEELSYNDVNLLHSLNAIDGGGNPRATIAGLLLFGTQLSLRRHFPSMRVDYIRVEGKEWVPNPEKRYQAVEMSGPLLTLVPKVISQTLSDIPRAFSLSDSDVHRKEVPLIPLTVIREAIVNAMMHRSYRMREPVQIIRYSNRLEIRNPGHSLVPDERLGEPGSLTRNEKIAAVLHEVGLAETKGTGIRVMRDAMTVANLTSPLFESNRQKDNFTVTLLVHHLLGPDDVIWLKYFRKHHLSDDEARALIVVREIGAIDNLAYRNINKVDSLTASKHLLRLRDAGLLEQKGKGVNTYYTPSSDLLLAAALTVATTKGSTIRLSRGLDPSGSRLNPLGKGLPASLSHLPATGPIFLPKELAEAVNKLGERTTIEETRVIILRLCEWRPLRTLELAAIMGRSAVYLRDRFLAPMVERGELKFLYERNPSHPRQAYVSNISKKP